MVVYFLWCVCVRVGLPVVWARGKILCFVMGGWIGLGCVLCEMSVRGDVG